MKKLLFFCYLFALFTVVSYGQDSVAIALAGKWRFAPDLASIGMSEQWYKEELPKTNDLFPQGTEMLTNDWIQLPGSTDESKIGYFTIPITQIKREDETVRKYAGAYWVQRKVNIPGKWNGQPVFFRINQLPAGSKIYWDSELIGSVDDNLESKKFGIKNSSGSKKDHLLTVFVERQKGSNENNPISEAILLSGNDQISLLGKWRLALDVWNKGGQSSWYKSGWNKGELPDSKDLHTYYTTYFRGADFTMDDWINLPGSPAEENIGTILSLSKGITPGLQRKISYDGSFWVQRRVTLPKSWQGKTLEFMMEKLLGVGMVFWDGNLVGECRGYDVPQRFEINSSLTGSGSHTITIYTNKKDSDYPQWGHGVSSENGVSWTGIIGKIELRAESGLCIKNLQIYPDIRNNSVRISLDVKKNMDRKKPVELTFSVRQKGSDNPFEKLKTIVLNNGEKGLWQEEVIFNSKARLWNEFHPNLYELKTELKSGEISDVSIVSFGMREFSTKGQNFYLNGNKIFLRGAQQDGTSPIEGYTPMDEKYWNKVMEQSKAYGLNHLRCHTWCPPDAALEAADKYGIIMQVELPSYGPEYKELMRIIDYLGNHPSFCLLALGNELFNHDEDSRKAINEAREHDPRHLYTCTSNPFSMDCDDDFFVAAWGWGNDSIIDTYPEKVNIGGKPIVGIVWSGADVVSTTRFNTNCPATQMDYRNEIKPSPVPVISHEAGQWAMFPDLKALDKYTGTLMNPNYERIKLKLDKRGMLDQADEFAMASGKFSALLYKEEIESALRTPNLGGINLLGINDFEGQNLAVVGILDEFWDSKDIVSAEVHRQYCGAIVPLARMEKRLWKQDEVFQAKIELANYGENDLNGVQPHWQITSGKNKIFAEGKLNRQNVPQGELQFLGEVLAPLNKLHAPQKYILTVWIPQTEFKNSWEFWVYPTELTAPQGNVEIFSSWNDEVKEALISGQNVLLMPDPEALRDGCRESCFSTVFWNSIFKWMQKAHTLGVLCDPSLPVFSEFPTDSYSNWQWWDIAMNANAMYLNNFPEQIKPLVQVIDTYAINDKLAYLWECKAGKGKLVVSTINFSRNMDDRIPSKQLYKSLLDYMNGADFKPKDELSLSFLNNLFK